MYDHARGKKARDQNSNFGSTGYISGKSRSAGYLLEDVEQQADTIKNSKIEEESCKEKYLNRNLESKIVKTKDNKNSRNIK